MEGELHSINHDKNYQRLIVQGYLLLDLFVDEGCLAVTATGHMKMLWIFILLDVAANLVP